MKYTTLCLALLSCILLAIGCKKTEKQKAPFGQWQCNGYEHIWYAKEGNRTFWNGTQWDSVFSYIQDSNRMIPNQLVTVEAGSEGVLLITNLVRNADPAVLPGLNWDIADKIAVYLDTTDSANHEKTYKRLLPNTALEHGLITEPVVIVTLTFDYVTNDMDIMYASYVRGPHNTFTSNTIYLRSVMWYNGMQKPYHANSQKSTRF